MHKTALLASDMDGTVIPLSGGPERDAEIDRFRQLIADNPQLALAYVSGRHLSLGLAGVARHHLPPPDIFVCDVGTTIYFHDEQGRWQRDEGYRGRLLDSWQGYTGPAIAALLAGLPALIPQEEEKQAEFKQSYYLDRGEDHAAALAAIHASLAAHDLQANTIYSVDPIKEIGLIDVLPPIAAKDLALSYLWQKLALPKANVVYAGDSGNDLLAFVSGFNAIVVDNTAEPVKAEVRRQARAKGIEQHIFFAPTRFAQGVIDGCAHFHLFRPH
ncbi:MAG: hypothetical protein OEV73_13480 [Desulfobulbaceae bacterium]|nr:hypothetical protein [Desulfobulbaceae bacterium]